MTTRRSQSLLLHFSHGTLSTCGSIVCLQTLARHTPSLTHVGEEGMMGKGRRGRDNGRGRDDGGKGGGEREERWRKGWRGEGGAMEERVKGRGRSDGGKGGGRGRSDGGKGGGEREE